MKLWWLSKASTATPWATGFSKCRSRRINANHKWTVVHKEVNGLPRSSKQITRSLKSFSQSFVSLYSSKFIVCQCVLSQRNMLFSILITMQCEKTFFSTCSSFCRYWFQLTLHFPFSFLILLLFRNLLFSCVKLCKHGMHIHWFFECLKLSFEPRSSSSCKLHFYVYDLPFFELRCTSSSSETESSVLNCKLLYFFLKGYQRF